MPYPPLAIDEEVAWGACVEVSAREVVLATRTKGAGRKVGIASSIDVMRGDVEGIEERQ
jgi:hypothetical protein